MTQGTPTADRTTFDPEKAQAFAGQMIGVMNGATIALMNSIGHQVGLFDTMATLPPSTTAQIAAAAGLNERYVREWLGAMAAARIVDYDAATAVFALSPEHAASLTRAAGPGNIAAMAQLISMLGEVEDQLVGCFRNGGGVPYSSYRKFQRLMAEDSGHVQDLALVDAILPLIDGLPERLHAGIDVADVACGMGHAINLMARAFPNSRFTGYDFSEEGIAAARAEATAWGLVNARFELRDVTVLALDHAYDFVTAFDAIHDQAHPAQVLAGISRALRPAGVFLMVDIRASSNLADNLDHPMAPTLYAISTMHCMTVSLALGGAGLGTMWGEQIARQMLGEAGFTTVDVKSIEGDIFNNYFVATKG